MQPCTISPFISDFCGLPLPAPNSSYSIARIKPNNKPSNKPNKDRISKLSITFDVVCALHRRTKPAPS